MAQPITNTVGTPLLGASGTWQQQQAALRALGARQALAKPAAPAATVQQQTATTAPVSPIKGLLTPTATPQTPLQQAPANPVPTYPGLVSSLASTSLRSSPVAGTAAGGLVGIGQTGSPTALGYASQAAGYGAGSIPIAAEANDIAQRFGQKYADVGTAGSRFEAGQLSTGTTPVAEGNAAVTAQTTAAQQEALAKGEEAALQGIGYQLTGQQQAALAAEQGANTAISSTGQQLTGLNEAGGLGLTAQGLQQSGLGAAAGFAQPQAYGLTSQPYNPLTDSYGGGGTGGVLSRATLAGQVAGAQAAGAAPGQVAAQNTITGGTAGVGANEAVLNPAYASYLQLQQTTQNIDQFGQLLTKTMSDGGINPYDVKFANAKLADVRNQLSSTQQAIYDNTLASLRSRVSGLLAAGGSEIPSQITSDANKILDGTLPLGALSGVLARIQTEGNILLSNQAGVVNTAYAGTQGQNTNTGGGNGSLYDY